MSPTQRQMDALRFIRGYQVAHGGGPTLEEIARGLGMVAKSGAWRLVIGLEERGLLERFIVGAKKGRWQLLERCASREFDVLTDIAVPRAPDGAPLYFVSIA